MQFITRIITICCDALRDRLAEGRKDFDFFSLIEYGKENWRTERAELGAAQYGILQRDGGREK